MILDDIVKSTKLRYQEIMKKVSLEEIKNLALKIPKGDYPFYKAINDTSFTIISEIKKASPSKNVISVDFDYINIAKAYENGGATAISCLTEPTYFKGSDEYLRNIKKSVNIPVLRKDFIISEYQIYEAKVIGADAILLIVAILTDEELNTYLQLADCLGLAALVETHDDEEIRRALKTEAKLIGINNRNLKDFTVDINNTIRLRSLVPENIKIISESGIQTIDDIKALREAKVNGVLIGEALMKSNNPQEMVKEIRND